MEPKHDYVRTHVLSYFNVLVEKGRKVRSKLDPDKQPALIKAYENLLNQLGDGEAVLFGDAAHPTLGVRPVGCWAPKDTPVAVEQTSGRQRLTLHDMIDLETGKTRMIALWKNRWASTGPFGCTVLSIDEALRFIAYEDIFWVVT